MKWFSPLLALDFLIWYVLFFFTWHFLIWCYLFFLDWFSTWIHLKIYTIYFCHTLLPILPCFYCCHFFSLGIWSLLVAIIICFRAFPGSCKFCLLLPLRSSVSRHFPILFRALINSILGTVGKISFFGPGKLWRRIYLPKLFERFWIARYTSLVSVAIDQRNNNNHHVSGRRDSRVFHAGAGHDVPIGAIGPRIGRSPGWGWIN